MNFTNLPPELIEAILVLCDPIVVSKVAQTCTTLRSLIYFSPDSMLWRELYLTQDLDDPRICVSHNGILKPTPIDWKKELKKVVRARTVVDDTSLGCLRRGELEDILQTLLGLTTCVRPWTTDEIFDLEELSKNLVWVAAKLRKGFLDRLVERSSDSGTDSHAQPKLTFAERQLAARLHTYFGLTKSDSMHRNIVKARAYVYLLRNYRPESDYGPYHPNGTVNWEHIRAVHHVVSTHVTDLDETTEFVYRIYLMSLPFTQVVAPHGFDFAKEEDWAGVTGLWSVSFCFCDHRELLQFNESSSTTIDATLFEAPDFREVFRSLNVNLVVARTEKDPDHPTRPIIYFYGQMVDPSTPTMTGKIQMTPDNQVRWHFVSGEQGNAIWSSEGIQIGGLHSAYGILGSWTTIFHDAEDPVGPFWMRKHNHTHGDNPSP
ncbi:hypothetical protein CPB83DRAFT_864245 [Crepidotus variabilis]|uniref:F-box domain-containing protein n=1 Tax=Crepidotus variabilis TaxID=179855 RepID=A0A9P6E4Z1_9AGAR|nr:hypothetical protein CPB83DRAFT_864245 [Crepidotus variabilis]